MKIAKIFLAAVMVISGSNAFADESGDVGVSITSFSCNDTNLDAHSVTLDTATEQTTVGQYNYTEGAPGVLPTLTCSADYTLTWGAINDSVPAVLSGCDTIETSFSEASAGVATQPNPTLQDTSSGGCDDAAQISYAIAKQ